MVTRKIIPVVFVLVCSLWAPVDAATPTVTEDFPTDLFGRDFAHTIDRSSTRNMRYSATRGHSEVLISAALKQPQWARAERIETTSYQIVDIGHVYPNILYVAGEYNNGNSVIERWQIQTAFALGGQVQISTNKSLIYLGQSLTHLRQLAVPTNESFIVVQSHASGDLLLVDLPSLDITTLLSAIVQPELVEFDHLEWMKHIVDGDVLVVTKQQNHVWSFSGPVRYILLWDLNVDGTPNMIESLTEDNWDLRGYDDLDSWIPERDFY